MKRTLIIALVSIMCGIASGEEAKVFTNDDLDGYKQGGGINDTSKVGTMSKNYSHESGDVNAYGSGRGRGRYGAAGGYYNKDGSSTNYSKEVTEQDIRLIEAEEYAKKKEAEERQVEIERKRQLEEMRERDREERRRVEREEERLRRDSERRRYYR